MDVKGAHNTNFDFPVFVVNECYNYPKTNATNPSQIRCAVPELQREIDKYEAHCDITRSSPVSIVCRQAIARVDFLPSPYRSDTQNKLHAILRSLVVLWRMLFSVNMGEKTLKPFQFEPDRDDWPDSECQDNERSEVNTVGRARDHSWCLCKNCVTMTTDEESMCCCELDNVRTVKMSAAYQCITEHVSFNNLISRQKIPLI
ncbi:hypothetical protein PR048_009291 [Dryococelus australis]|uniref:Uncharacterized protein n=1 Tax=Dryococelus australis TaxID=614101 RepID=A0ABQ9HZJ6_9NEOP|nr:hypothetical protein PR048_009291 [Dryococelus australis]